MERAVGVRPDYTLETLPLVDHWLEGARGEVAVDVTRVIVQAGGAYFGEVVRRRHPSWWALGTGIPEEWEIQLETTYLSLRPLEVVREALRIRETDDETFEDPAGDIALLDIDEDDRAAVVARLAELPEVSEVEYRSLATLIEVIDIAVETARSRGWEPRSRSPPWSPRDYQRLTRRSASAHRSSLRPDRHVHGHVHVHVGSASSPGWRGPIPTPDDLAGRT